MNCPSDGTTLLMSERQGIEIDYCPQCRGVWLDRGELDKILERAQAESASFAGQPSAAPAAAAAAPAAAAPIAAPQPARYPEQRPAEPRYEERRDTRYEERRDPRYDSRSDNRYDSRGGYQKKKKSPFDFLGELFE